MEASLYMKPDLQLQLQPQYDPNDTINHIVLKTVVSLIESRDEETGNHVRNTQELFRKFVHHLLTRTSFNAELANIHMETAIQASMLHDVGKISVQDNVLAKPGRLSSSEYEIMKSHVVQGVKIIEGLEQVMPGNSFLEYAKTMVAYHHERFDGTGYPYGLKGEEIPLLGRIMAIVDVYEALTSKRYYKDAMTHQVAVAMIRSESGKQFDPELVQAFVKTRSIK